MAPSSSPWRVVVVEDDQAVAAVHCRLVAKQPGFQVVGRAATASEAYVLMDTVQPDLVLLDLELPGPSGLALLRRVRAEKKETEAIVITAHARPDVVRTSMQLGAVDYLVKPFWPDRLVESLAKFAARMEGLRQARPLDQQEIDSVRAGSAGVPIAPTNIRLNRLAEVRMALERDAPMTADDIAAETGMARVTARRYLEHLVSRGQCSVDSVVDGPGRPRKAYRLWHSGPVGSSR